MGARLLVLLLVPSVALGDEPPRPALEPKLHGLSAPQLFEEYERVQDLRPRLAAPIVLATVGGVAAFIDALVLSARWTTTANGVTTQQSGAGTASWAILALSLGAFATAVFWFSLDLLR